MSLYRLLVRLCFPAAFRRRFGEEMAETFADRRRWARRHGAMAVVGLWWRTVRDLLRQGWNERRAVQRAKGDPLMRGILQDARFALRLFIRQPAFAIAAVLTLALGIGANVAIFSVIDGVMLRKPRLPDADQVVSVSASDHQPLNPANFVDLRQGTTDVFAALAAYEYPRQTTLTGLGAARFVTVVAATPEIFGVMGAPPVLGRPFTHDDAPDERPAVVSYAFWHGVLGADPHAVGRQIVLDGEAWTVVGVMPDGIALPDADVWRPLVFTPEQLGHRNSFFLSAYGRLRPGATVEQATAALTGVLARIVRTVGNISGHDRAEAVRWQDDRARGVRDQLLFAQGLAVLVLLVGCANLTNLLLARATERYLEFSVRAAIGAGRGRLARQLLTESVVLALLGGLAGVVLAYWIVPPLAAAYPVPLPNVQAIAVNVPALAAALACACATTVLVGVAPALVASRLHVMTTLRGGSRPTASPATRLLRSGLVTAEVGLALMLLVGAGLLVRSFVRLTSQPIGFSPDRILTAEVTLPPASYPPARARQFYQDLFDRLDVAPDVVRAAAASSLPFAGRDAGFGTMSVVNGRRVSVGFTLRIVSPDYFATLGIPITDGRNFGATDTPDTDRVAVVNQTFAHRYGGTRGILGFRVRESDTFGWITVVGVAADTRALYRSRPRPELYLPVAQAEASGMRPRSMILLLHTRGNVESGLPLLQSVVTSLDPDLPLAHVASLTTLMGESVASQRFNMKLLAAFAATALILAALGIYGVTSYVAGLRSREAGIRLALGARPGQVKALLARQGLRPIVVGSAAGLAGAWLLAGLLKSQLFQITAHDPWTLASATVALLAVGAAASWIPARRASRVDPAAVLRTE
jgi:putative ABC transport system permease protein